MASLLLNPDLSPPLRDINDVMDVVRRNKVALRGVIGIPEVKRGLGLSFYLLGLQKCQICTFIL